MRFLFLKKSLFFFLGALFLRHGVQLQCVHFMSRYQGISKELTTYTHPREKCIEARNILINAKFLGFQREIACAMFENGLMKIEYFIKTAPTSHTHAYYREVALIFLEHVSSDKWLLGARGSAVFITRDDSTLPRSVVSQLRMIQVPLLAHSILQDESPGAILIPDWHFVGTKGFLETRKLIYQFRNLTLEHRRPVVYWRGSTTGMPDGHGARHCYGLKRVQLCNVSLPIKWVDAKVSKLTQWCNNGNRLQRRGLMAHQGTDLDWLRFRGLFEIDGNVNAWGHFWRMGSGSVIFKIDSNFTNYIIQKEIPHVHYIPIHRNLSNLAEVTEKVTRDENLPELSRIASAAERLTREMTLESEVSRVAHELIYAWK